MHAMYDVQGALQASKFFDGISAENRAALAGISRVKEYRKRSIIFHEAERGAAVFILLAGDVQLHKVNPEGKEIVIKVIKPGEIFGEVILFEKDSYPVTAVAASPSRLLELPKQGMLRLLDQQEFRNDFIAALMRKLRYLSDRIQFLSSFDVEDRVRLFLREHFGESVRIECRLSKKDFAAAIGTTPESLSRALLRLKEAGSLVWQDDVITVTADFWHGSDTD